MKTSLFKRMLALLLCLTMLLPNLTGLARAADTESSDPSQPSGESQKETGWVPVDPEDIPVYSTASGKVSQELECECGNGLSRDGAQSHMTMVTGTNETEYRSYLTVLEEAGFTKTFENSIAAQSGNNLFSKWLSPKKDYVLTVYYTPVYGEVHIIADTAEDMVKSFAGGFVYQSTTGEVAQPMVAMYGLSMSPNGYDITTETAYNTGARNCGALIVIRMPDNSLFINDGGDLQQWSDETCADFMEFCRELTGKSEGERVVINTWFISHAHSDHFAGIPRFFDRYHDQIDIKNVMYNIDDERLGTTRDMSKVLNMVKGYFPGAKYYKPHTGEHFDIAGVEFDVLYTHEDRFLPNADGEMIIDIRDGDETNPKENRDGTYRSFLYEQSDIVNLSDFNDTSTVLKVIFPEEITDAGKDVSMILYADVNLADQVIMDMWPADVTQTDIMMVPHHGHDAHPELVEESEATIFLYTQAKSAIYGPNGIVDCQQKTADDGTVSYVYKQVDPDGTDRKALVNNFLAMYDMDNEKYFDTTATRKTYWEGTETACILFGEDTTFQSMPSGLSRDSEDPAGFTVYTMDAPFFPYGGWVNTPSVVAGESQAAATEVTQNSLYRYEMVTQPLYNKRYLIVHNKTNSIMMYDPIAWYEEQEDPNLATVMPVGTQAQVAAGTAEAYFGTELLGGTQHPQYIYMDDADRNDGLWILLQKLSADYDNASIKNSEVLSDRNTDGEGGYYSVTKLFGGDVRYHHAQFSKGYGPYVKADGTTTNGNGVYWESHKDNDYDTTAKTGDQWRFLAPGNGDLFREKETENTSIEYFSDGTCLIYYYTDDATDVRVLSLNSNGYWEQKKYVETYDSTLTGTALKNAKKEAVDKVKERVAADLEDLKVRLYQYQSYTADEGTKKTLTCTGIGDYDVLKGTAKEAVLHSITSGLTVTDTLRGGLEIHSSGSEAKVGYYWVDMSAYDGVNDCTATVYYRNDDGTDTVLGTVQIRIRQELEMYMAYNDDDTVYAGTVYGSKYGFYYQDAPEKGISEDAVYKSNEMDMTVTVYHADGTITTEIVPITPDMLQDGNGDGIDTSVAGVYSHRRLVYDGQVVDEGFTLNVAESSESQNYPASGQEGAVVPGKQSTTSPEQFKTNGVANIELSATGTAPDKGIDLIIVMDLSGSMKNGLDTNSDAPDYNDSRMVAMENSLSEVIAMLQAVSEDGKIRVAMSDFGDLDHFAFEDAVVNERIRDRAYYDVNINNDINKAYEFYNHLNFITGVGDNESGVYGIIDKKFNLGHCSYTGQVIPTVYTNMTAADPDGSVDASAFVDVDRLDMGSIVAKMDQNVSKSLGTNYDVGLEYAYRLGYAIRQQNQAAGEDRELVCIFMSDGAAIQYNYFSGNADSSAWGDWLMGVPEDVTSVADYYADPANWPEEIEKISKVLLDQLMGESAISGYSKLITPEYQSRSEEEYFRYDSAKTRADAEYFFTYMDDQGYQLDWEFLCRLAKANGIADFDYTYYGSNQYDVAAGKKPFTLQELVDKLTTTHPVYKYQKDANGDIVYTTGADGSQVPVYELDENNEKIIDYYQSELINPDYYNKANTNHADKTNAVYRYYPQYTETPDASLSYTEQFFAAMAAVGVECDWALYARLTEVNRGVIKTTLNTDTARGAVRDLIEKMRVPVAGYGDYQTLSPYDYFYNAEGKNWWAEAIKGDRDKLYPVINKYAKVSNPAWGTDAYYGTVRNRFTTGTGLELDGQDYISGFEGLDMELYTVSFSICDDRLITAQIAENVLKNIATAPSYFFSTSTQAGLTSALKAIVSTLSTAAADAYFMDTMGDAFDLSTERTITNSDGTVLTLEANPTVRVLEYDMVDGVRTGEPNIREVVTFTDLDGDGDTDAWSDMVYTTVVENGQITKVYTDIWDETTGVISAKYFYYNANKNKSVDIFVSGKGTLTLPAETFYWEIGVIGETQMVLEYQVYLTGSFDELERLEGNYATNASATLHYTNYLDVSNCSQSVESPIHSWGQGKVAYAYYLVDKDGRPLAEDNSVTDFAGAMKFTDPADRILEWNELTTISGKEGIDKVPVGYQLFAPSVSYRIKATSTGGGQWSILSDPKQTTYVQYLTTNTNTQESAGLGLTNGEHHDTVVWFAVRQADGEMIVDKNVEAMGEDYLLTLDAFATGATTQVSKIKPADIVLVLDQSASMYTPAGMAADRLVAEGVVQQQNNGQLPAAAKVGDFAARVAANDSELLENAKHPGYYIAVHNTYDYIYIVQYIRYDQGELYDVSDDKWGWFYVPVKDTTTPVEFDPANAINDTDIALDNGGTYAQTQSNMALLTNVTYYQSQYGALYDSVTSFVNDLSVQAQENDVDHRVAIVGFSSPYYDAWNNYQGTGIYIDGAYHLYDTDYMYKSGDTVLDPDQGHAGSVFVEIPADPSEYAYVGVTAQTYKDALVDISTAAGLDNVRASIDALRTNFMQTCPAIGLRIARSIFRGQQIPLNDPNAARVERTSITAEQWIEAADPDPLQASNERDQIVILFTDGVPTVSMYSSHEDAMTRKAEFRNEYWNGNAGMRDAVNEANAAKQEGIKIYTIGTAASEGSYATSDARSKFLEMVSCNYPDASGSYDVDTVVGNNEAVAQHRLSFTLGTASEDMTYKLSAAEGEELELAFGTIMSSVTTPNVELNKDDVLRDVLSDYFDLIGSTEAEIISGIKVYTAAFNANGTVSNQWVPLEGAKITLGKTDSESDRYDIIDVSGYDYENEYYSSKARPKVEGGPSDYYGSKLIVQIPIRVAKGFVGGVDVPTNEDISGIYDKEEDEEKIVIPFPIPTVDVDSGMVTNKTAELVEGTDNQYLLTLEAYATGSLRELTSTKPADIVLVLDHSASMRTPVGATEILHSNAEQIYGYKGQTDKGQITHADLLLEKGQHLGYYVAQSQFTGSWFIMQYQPDKQLWDLHQVPSTQALVHSADGNEVEKTLTSTHAYLNDVTGEFKDLVFYKSQYAMLYESVLSFVAELHDSGVAHNVAIVGFAGSTTFGSRLYVGGDETGTDGSVHKKYETMYYHANASETRRTELYRKAMKNVAMTTEYSELLTLVEAIDTNYSFTCPAVGLKMANDIFKANEVDANARNRIVILFTDGLPNVMIDEDAIDPNNTSEQIYDEIINQSYISKNTYGAQVYSISTSTTGDKAEDRLFMSYTSSDYPDATSFADHGNPVEDAPVFTKEVSSFEDMDLAFGNVTNHFASTTVKLDGTTLLVEILSEYFDLLNQGKLDQDGNYLDIKVYMQPYSPTGWKDKVLMGDEAIITLTSSDNSHRLDTVTVAGFDYAAEFVSEIPRTVNGADYYGSKIVVEVNIITREGFWGGENVPTNDVKTGLYPPDSDVPAEIFPVPEVNVWPDVRVEDTVVIDYGLGVDIDLLEKHPLIHGNNKILGFVNSIPEKNLATTLLNNTPDCSGAFGSIALNYVLDQETQNQISSGSVRYQLDLDKGMQMKSHETFYYVGQYSADGKSSYYYGSVTVIPATVMYFEEHFFNYSVKSDIGAVAGWDPPAGTVNNALTVIQDEDRPGDKHPYGHDSHYAGYTQFSMGSAQKVNVFLNGNGQKIATANFTFQGTGFDVISLTSNTTGTILVRAFPVDGNDTVSETAEWTGMVDTYYGYVRDDEGNWIVSDSDDENAIYQIPVIKAEGLPYGKYAVEIYVAYNEWFDHGQYSSGNQYDFYLDAIRIYDPANNGEGNDVIRQAYLDDGECFPEYEEVRDKLLPEDEAAEIDKELPLYGAVFIDGVEELFSVKDYAHFGPNNEVYLKPQQVVHFTVAGDTNIASVHLSMKSLGAKTYAQIYSGDNLVEVIEIDTSTDLYYDITGLGNVTIVCAGSDMAVLSITNVKTTYQLDSGAVAMEGGPFTVTSDGLHAALLMLNGNAEPEVQIPTLELDHPSLSFEEEIKYNIYFNASNIDDVVEFGLALFSERLSDGTVENALQIIPGYVTDGTIYMASTNGIPARNMGDTVYFKVYAKLSDGSYVYSDVAGFSAVAYAKSILKNNGKSAALVVALMNYGAAAQEYFGETGELMNSFLTAEQQALVLPYDQITIADAIKADESKVGGFAKTAGWLGGRISVSFESTFVMNYYFSPEYAVEGEMKLYYWDAATYESADVLTVDNASGCIVMTGNGSGVYMASYMDIAAKQIEDTLYVAAVYENGGNTYATGVIGYSLAAYCKQIAGNDDSAMQDLAKATAVYGSYAKEYFGK